jgi:hypothetical protein
MYTLYYMTNFGVQLFTLSNRQTFIYWVIGTLSNEPATLGVYTGFFKAFQNAGAASGWKIDASHVPYLHFLIACWVLIFISFPGAYWVAFTTKETTGYSEEIEQEQQDRIEHDKLGIDEVKTTDEAKATDEVKETDHENKTYVESQA